MESLSLHTLANSLPLAQQNAEKDLANNFKAAAFSITNLYRSSRQNSKRAYNAGYAAACQDLLNMIQQGLSLNQLGSAHDAEGGMTIGRVMDWTEARLEAIKSREEEEDEEEEREKEKEGERARSQVTSTAAPSKPETKSTKAHNAPSISDVQSKNDQPSLLPTPRSPQSQQNPQVPLEPSSPSPPPPALRSVQRPVRPRPLNKGEHVLPYINHATGGIDSITDGFSSTSPSSSFSDISIPIAAGAKRRHAMMMMLDSSTSPVTIGGSSATHQSANVIGNNINSGTPGSGSTTSRRRTRSMRNATLQSQHQNIGLTQVTSEPMDIEEDGGRERKRAARR